jgi:hypothetical protein
MVKKKDRFPTAIFSGVSRRTGHRENLDDHNRIFILKDEFRV